MNIFDKALILQVTFARPGNSKQVSTEEVDVAADKSMLHLSKDLLDCREFKAVVSFDGKTSSWMRRRALPSPLGKGFHLLPIPQVKPTYQYLVERLAGRQPLIDEMVKVYPARTLESKQRLNGLWQADDYPSADEFAAAFDMTWRPVSWGVPDQLATIDETFYAEAKNAATLDARNASDEITEELRARFARAVDTLANSLEDRADGKKRKLYETTVTGLTEYLESFAGMNIVDDAALAALVEKGKTVMQGVTTEALRDNDALRTYVRDGLAGIKKDTAVSIRPKRAVVIPPVVSDGASEIAA